MLLKKSCLYLCNSLKQFEELTSEELIIDEKYNKVVRRSRILDLDLSNQYLFQMIRGKKSKGRSRQRNKLKKKHKKTRRVHWKVSNLILLS